MSTPKTFYRQLDALLARIAKDGSGKDFLNSIMIELENNFGRDLAIVVGSVYEQRDKEFIRTFSSRQNHLPERLAMSEPAIEQVLKHGSYIYDHPEYRTIFQIPLQDLMTPAAISVTSPEGHWLLVFGLKDGWVREEITLFLNAVRTALNYRLFSDLIGGELERAVQIQKSLLPKSSPRFEGFDIHGHSIPAELVGGDFYEYFEFEEGSFGFTIGDASGHGLPAALLVRDVVIGLRMGLASEYKTVYTLKKLNKVIQRSTYSSNFVSLFMGELEKSGHLFYVNAGHPAPFLLSGDTISDLGPTGIVLGFMKDIELQRSHIYMPSGSVLVLYTDGIFERQNAQEEQFGEETLKSLVRDHRNKSAAEISRIIFETVFDFGQSRTWEDDATVVVIRRL